MLKVVYFNQWFSSIANIIDDIKEKHGDSVKIIGSSKTKDHSYKYSVDTFIEETWVEGKDEEETMKNYVDYILHLCEQYKVDIFFVKKYAKHIMKRREEFVIRGIFLISDDFTKIEDLDDKAGTYKKLVSNYDDKLDWIVPEHYIFTSTNEAEKFVRESKEKNKNICFKLNSDEGGASFRQIDDNEIDIKSLSSARFNKVTTEETLKLIQKSSEEELTKLLFMETLDSPEISVDCYNSKQGFIAICRRKYNGRKQKIYYDSKISDICKEIGYKLGLKFPYNVQFRIKQGKDYHNIENLRLLEINPRMSGGLYYETMCGKNIAEVCLLDVLNREKEYSINEFINFEDKYVTHVEKAILLDKD